MKHPYTIVKSSVGIRYSVKSTFVDYEIKAFSYQHEAMELANALNSAFMEGYLLRIEEEKSNQS